MTTNDILEEKQEKDAKQGSQKDPETRERKARTAPPPPQPALRFTPTAWAKLLFFRDSGPTEIGGFAVTEANELLRVVDFVTVKQDVTVASVAFDDSAVADFFDAQVDVGRKPEQFARIWLHTHPGNSPEPSHTDEETFHRVFGHCEWAVMFIIAQNGKTSARLRFNIGPRGQILIPVTIDYAAPFSATDRESWESEYHANVRGADSESLFGGTGLVDLAEEFYDTSYPQDWIEELELMDPDERERALEELASRPDLYSFESEMVYE